MHFVKAFITKPLFKCNQADLVASKLLYTCQWMRKFIGWSEKKQSKPQNLLTKGISDCIKTQYGRKARIQLSYVQGIVKKICKGIFRHSATCTCPAKSQEGVIPSQTVSTNKNNRTSKK